MNHKSLNSTLRTGVSAAPLSGTDWCRVAILNVIAIDQQRRSKRSSSRAMGGGKAGLYALFASFFFMSVGFPTIFALGIRGLGDYTKLASSLIVMSIVGGAIAPPFMGHIADKHSMRIALWCRSFASCSLHSMASRGRNSTRLMQ